MEQLPDAIGLDDLDRIAGDQFDHYVGAARPTDGALDWPALRLRLLGALTAAGGIEWIDLDRDPRDAQARNRRRRTRMLVLIDQVRERYDPAGEWPAFRAELFAGWQHICR